MALIVLYYVQLSLFFLPSVTATCYNPDGTAVTDPAYQPCAASSGAISMCCGTNRTLYPDVCQSNGLCFNPCTQLNSCTSSSGGQYWRESCTDSSWRSPFCLLGACTNSPSGGLISSDKSMSQCAIDGSWCCLGGLTSDACCSLSGRVIIPSTVGVSTVESAGTSKPTTLSSMTTATSSTVNSYTSSTTTSTSNSSASSSSPSINGVSVGVGVGIGIGGLIVVATVAFLLFRRRKLRASNNHANRRDAVGHEIQDLDLRAYENGTQQQYRETDGLDLYSGLAKPELDGADRRRPRSNTKYYELPTRP